MEFPFRRTPLLLALLISGCATVQEPPPPLTTEEIHILKRTLAHTKREELLYKLLLAEIALQKRHLKEALHHYLEIARETKDPKIIRRTAAIASPLRDFKALSEILEIWLEIEPEAIDARRRAVLVAIELGDFERALAHLKFLFQRDRTLAERLLLNLAAQKRLLEGFLAKLKEAFPNFPEIYYSEALLYLEQEKPQFATLALSRGLEVAREKGGGHLSLGYLLDRLVEKRARGVLRQLTEHHPREERLWLAQLRLLLNDNRLKEAERLLKKILKRWPRNPQALWTKALLDLQRGNIAEAERVLRRLTRFPDWQGRAYLYLGHIATQKGHYREALSWYEKVEEEDLLFEADLNRLLTFIRLERFEEAEELLDRLFFDYPQPQQQARLYLVKAELYLRQNNPEAAFFILGEALRRFPDHPDLLYMRSMVADELERYEVARRDLQRLVELRPSDPQALNALGYTLLDRLGKVEASKPYIEKAFQLKPEDPAIQDSYGWLLFKEGKLEEALKHLQEAYRKHPDPEIGAHLAEVLLALGKIEEARKIWREVKQKVSRLHLKLWVETFKQKLDAARH